MPPEKSSAAYFNGQRRMISLFPSPVGLESYHFKKSFIKKQYINIEDFINEKINKFCKYKNIINKIDKENMEFFDMLFIS